MKVSEWFACRVTGQNRSTKRRPPAATTPAGPDAGLRAWLRARAKDHPRRGFRPAYHDARGEGWNVNDKKVQRLWRDEGLRVRATAPTQAPGRLNDTEPPTADAPNVVWLRDGCVNINMFWSLAQARVVISDWKVDYNHRRRHSPLGYQAPAV